MKPAVRRGARAVTALAVTAVTSAAAWLVGGAPAGAATGPPSYDHIVVVVEENHTYGENIDNDDAPYLTSLARDGANMTRSYAVTHPSQPNYLALFSGSTQGLSSNDCPNSFSSENLGHQALAAGRTFIGYSDSLPSNGYTGCESYPYARKHSPWVNFGNVPASSNLSFGEFPEDYSQLPALAFVTPDLTHDMHDGDTPVATGDAWLSEHLGGYAEWAKANNSLLVVTFDEDDESDGNHIPTVFYGANVKPGDYSQRIDHYSVLRTLQSALGVGCVAKSCDATPVSGIWTTGGSGDGGDGAPGAVSNLVVSGATDVTLTIAWVAPSSGPVTGYKLGWTESGTGRRWDSGSPHYSPSASPVTFTGLLAGKSYEIRVTAFNTNGDGPTVTTTGTTTGGSDGGGDGNGGDDGDGGNGNGGDNGGTTSSAPMPYPAKAVAVYYMMWSSSPSPPLSSLPSGINVLNLAFGQGDPPSLPGWSPQGKAAFVSGIRTLRARGVRIVLSIGGEGGDINVANRSAFVKGVMAINAEVPLDGIDWDLEGPAMGTSDVVAVSTALKQQRGADFAVTMAPNGGNVDHYIDVAVKLHAAGALDMIGQQFYDSPVSVDAADGRIKQMIKAGIPESKVGIGMMIANDSKHWTLDQCVSNTRTLKSRHPKLRGGYLWESSRSGTADWVSRVGAILTQ